jgi:hypothetical protein
MQAHPEVHVQVRQARPMQQPALVPRGRGVRGRGRGLARGPGRGQPGRGQPVRAEPELPAEYVPMVWSRARPV